MRKRKSFIKFFVLIAIVFAGFSYTFSKYDKNEYRILTSKINHQDNKPVGEIIDAFSMRQSIDNIKNNLDSLEGGKLCLSLQMANYSNRANKGSFRVGLESNGKEELVEIKASAVADNKYLTVCFDTVTLKDTKTNGLAIILKGVNGLPGSSVTAWSTADTSSGNIEDSPNRSLMYKLSVVSSENTKHEVSMVFTFFTGIAIFLLSLPLLKIF